MENFVAETSTSSIDDDLLMNSTQGNQVVESAYQYFYQRQILAGLVVLIAIAGAVGNTGVIVAFILSKKLQTTTNFFVANLAVADLLNCLFMPWQTVATLSVHGWPIVNAQWLCVTSAIVSSESLGCSINSLALIAVNRWVVITKSRRTVCWLYTPRKLAVMVGVSWAIPLPFVLSAISTRVLGYDEYFSSCTIHHKTYGLTSNIMRSAVFYVIPLSVVVVCYLSIVCFLRTITRRVTGEGNRTIKGNLHKRQLQVTKNLLNIVLAFVICATPYFVTVNIGTTPSRKFLPWTGVMLLSNSCVNPIIYAVIHPDFKKVMKKMIRCQRIQRNSLQLRYT
ncbi:somatostatin receptor type 2-like [Asterias amurensis]|uniref:somatostatin receptor type 2-like n=1 Tax=Asterias amurensis TaxID=7602 RepID=UPI003AB8DE45